MRNSTQDGQSAWDLVLHAGAATAACTLLVALGGCKSSGSSGSSDSAAAGPINLPMMYMPDQTPNTAPMMPSGRPKVFIEVTDDRAMKDSLGSTTQDTPTPNPILATGATPAEFFKKALSTELGKEDVSVVDSASGATRTISVSLKTFQINEGGTYHAEVMATVEVKDESGKSLAHMPTADDSNKWGKSRSIENYQQTLSNATMGAIYKLLAQPEFVKAISS